MSFTLYTNFRLLLRGAIPLWLGSALLALRWEWRWAKYPERFLEVSNRNLSCGNCRHPGSCQSCVRKKRT